MTHAWLNLLAVLFSGLMGMNSTETAQTYPEQSEYSEYAVVERISDDEAILETSNGSFSVPMDLLPPMKHPEGAVIEIRLAPEEKERRLAVGKARLTRMKVAQNVVEL